MASSNNNMSFDAPVPEPKSVQQTKMLDTKAKEVFQTGTNVLKRQTTTHKPFGGLGVRGFADSSGGKD